MPAIPMTATRLSLLAMTIALGSAFATAAPAQAAGALAAASLVSGQRAAVIEPVVEKVHRKNRAHRYRRGYSFGFVAPYYGYGYFPYYGYGYGISSYGFGYNYGYPSYYGYGGNRHRYGYGYGYGYRGHFRHGNGGRR